MASDTIFYYGYPGAKFLYFVAASTLAALTLQSPLEDERKRGPRVSYRLLNIILAIIVSIYAFEAITVPANDFSRGPSPRDLVVVGRSLSAVTFAYQLCQLLVNRHPVWHPFRGSWVIGVLAEATFVVTNLIYHGLLPRKSEVLLVIIKNFLLLALVFGSMQPTAFPPAKPNTANPNTAEPNTAETDDCDCRHLLPAQTYRKSNEQVGYDSTERHDSASGSDSDQDSDKISAGKRRREQEHKDHLAGSGSWVQYAKGYRILLPHVLPERSRALMIQAFGVVACLIGSRLLAICIPRQAAIVVDTLYERNSADPRSAFVVFLSLQFLSSTAIPFVEKWFLTPLQSGFNQRIARAVYSHMMHLSAEFHDAQSLSDRLNAVNGGDALFQLIQQIFFHALPKSADLAVAAVYLSRTFGPYEVLITATTGLAFLTVANYLTGLSRLSMKDRQEKRLEEGSVRADGLRSWHTAAAFNRIPYECNRHDVAVAARHRAENRSDMQSNIFGSLQSTTLFLGFVASGFLAVSQIQSKAISPAQYVMLGTYWSQLSGALQFFAGVWKRISHLFVETELLLSFMRAEAKVRDKPSAKPLRFSKGTIEFDSVSFSYDGKRNILKSIDLVIPGGQKVAFVGPSGAGKSTMMRLLMRMYDLMQGAIRIDGQDLRDVTLSSLRQVMGVVPQRAEFFDGTVREHVGYGREKASDEEIKSACGAASIPLEKFTKGYDTNVNTLSGGEQQRVAIARAILKEANIILLDEATSSVDTETEYDIQQSLNALCTGRTTIVIAHRLSTVKNADKIVVFEDGGIIESGNHEELIKRCGKYASLWEKQFYHEPQNDNQG